MATASDKPKPKAGGVINGLFKRPGARVYLYHFKHQGKIHRGTTGCARLEDAREVLQKLRTDLAKAEKGIRPAKDMPTLKEAGELWTRNRGPQVGARQRSIVETAWRLHLEPLHGLRLDAIDTEKVDEMVSAYLAGGKGRAPGTAGGANVVLRALSAIFGYAIAAGYLAKRPYKRPQLDVQDKPITSLDSEAVRRLFETLSTLKASERIKDLFRLMLGLGLRVSEATQARVECVNLQGGTFTPWNPITGTKGGEADALPFPDWLLSHLARMVKDRTEGYLVPGTRKDMPYSRLVANQWLIKAEKGLGMRLTPHMLRAAYASMLDSQGVGAKTIQGALRHKQIKTTMKYIKKDLSRAQAAANSWGEGAGL